RGVEVDRREPGQLEEHLLVDAVEGGSDLLPRGVAAGVGVGHRPAAEGGSEVGADQVGVSGRAPRTRSRARKYWATARCPTCQATWVTPPGGRRNQSPAGVWSSRRSV